MFPETPPYSYHYHPFYKLFSEGLNPQYLSDQLDEIMFRLVVNAGDDYPSHLLNWHYYLLLVELLHIFWELEKTQKP